MANNKDTNFYLGQMIAHVRRIPYIEKKIDDLSKDLNNHKLEDEKRITKLENKNSKGYWAFIVTLILAISTIVAALIGVI